MNAEVTFLTRYYPPTPNINGEAVCDMVSYLEESWGIQCNVICIDRQAEGGGQKRQPMGHVIRLKTISERKQVLLRFITFLYDGFRLIRKALQFKDTLIIVTSSPPMLPFWASLLFGEKIKWAFWSLDLFPEGFASTGFISKKNPIFHWVKKKTYSGSPDFLITLGPQQAGHLQGEFKKNIPSYTLPCGVFFYQDTSADKPIWHEDDKIIFGYCGNIGDAHNMKFIQAAINHINPKKHLLILALYGNQAKELKKYAEGKNGVKIVDHVPRNQLHFIDVHLVSLRKEWTHIAVPSKAVSAIAMGGAILFCGSEKSDNWHMFKKAGWIIHEDAHMDKSVKGFMSSINREQVDAKKGNTSDLYERLKQLVLTTYESLGRKIKS